MSCGIRCLVVYLSPDVLWYIRLLMACGVLVSRYLVATCFVLRDCVGAASAHLGDLEAVLGSAGCGPQGSHPEEGCGPMARALTELRASGSHSSPCRNHIGFALRVPRPCGPLARTLTKLRGLHACNRQGHFYRMFLVIASWPACGLLLSVCLAWR
jgi:hypothetical protein